MTDFPVKRRITREDILDLGRYAVLRKERRPALLEMKRHRRIAVGPHATFYFENYETMWTQVHEMLLAEKGGEAQIVDELEAYNPLIPQGSELVATVMFEIEDPVLRDRVLRRLGGIEDTITLSIGGEKIQAEPERDIERTKANGKTSSVHFVHFPLSPAQIAAFRDSAVPLVLGFDHPDYGHLAVIPPATRQSLAQDFD